MADSNIVIIVPDYKEPEATYTVQVRYVDVDGNEVKEAPSPEELTVGQAKTYKAPAIEGKYFQYWTLDGIVVSYNNKFTVIRATTSVAELNAVYGTEQIEQQPTVRITQTYARIIDEKYVISNTLQYFAPEGYTVVESGFVFSTDGSVFGIAGGADQLTVDNPNVRKHLTPYTNVNETYFTFNARTSDPDLTLYIKAFLTYKDADGNTQTIYSDMTSGSYNSLTNPDARIVNVVWDPSSVLKATAVVPEDTEILESAFEGNVATLTIIITDDEVNDAVTYDEAAEAAKGYDVRIEGIDNANNAALLIVKMEQALAAGLAAEAVKVYHAGAAMTRVSSEAELTAENTFWYDAATGNVSIAVIRFSNFTFIYPLETYPIS